MPPARNKRASNAQVKKVNNGKETAKAQKAVSKCV
jgi:hypothetical protein